MTNIRQAHVLPAAAFELLAGGDRAPAIIAAAPSSTSLGDALPRQFGRARAICAVELAERMLLQPSGAGPKTLGQAAACLGVADRTLH